MAAKAGQGLDRRPQAAGIGAGNACWLVGSAGLAGRIAGPIGGHQVKLEQPVARASDERREDLVRMIFVLNRWINPRNARLASGYRVGQLEGGPADTSPVDLALASCVVRVHARADPVRRTFLRGRCDNRALVTARSHPR
ncbi:MAG TPA: hypothetical protein PKA20_00100 [Burkholderiaceae bacterium]|nr:hypothetical protein [Burkholderiaceae bacterium]